MNLNQNKLLYQTCILDVIYNFIIKKFLIEAVGMIYTNL
jgi:hypothetical protein